MIDWVQVLLITAAAFVGGELGQRWAIQQGRFVIFQPRWAYRALTLVTVFGCAMFIVTARMALRAPTSEHVWYLIGVSISVAFVTTLTQAVELHFARQEIRRLRSTDRR